MSSVRRLNPPSDADLRALFLIGLGNVHAVQRPAGWWTYSHGGNNLTNAVARLRTRGLVTGFGSEIAPATPEQTAAFLERKEHNAQVRRKMSAPNNKARERFTKNLSVVIEHGGIDKDALAFLKRFNQEKGK